MHIEMQVIKNDYSVFKRKARRLKNKLCIVNGTADDIDSSSSIN